MTSPAAAAVKAHTYYNIHYYKTSKQVTSEIYGVPSTCGEDIQKSEGPATAAGRASQQPAGLLDRKLATELSSRPLTKYIIPSISLTLGAPMGKYSIEDTSINLKTYKLISIQHSYAY